MNKVKLIIITIIAGLSTVYTAGIFAMDHPRARGIDRHPGLNDYERHMLMRQEKQEREMSSRQKAINTIMRRNYRRQQQGLPMQTVDEDAIIFEMRHSNPEKPM